MTTPSRSRRSPPAPSVPASPAVPPVAAPPSWPWRRGALILAGSRAADHHFGAGELRTTRWPPRGGPCCWRIAPAPVAAVAAFAPAPVGRVVGVVGVLVLVAGIAGGILHIGLFFVPALAALAIGTVTLRRDPPVTWLRVLATTSRYLTRDRLAVLAGLAAPLALAAVLVPFRASFPNTHAALAMLLVVVAIAANGDRLAEAPAAASTAVWFDFFLTQPYERFTITRRTDIETTVLLLVIGVAVTEHRRMGPPPLRDREQAGRLPGRHQQRGAGGGDRRLGARPR